MVVIAQPWQRLLLVLIAALGVAGAIRVLGALPTVGALAAGLAGLALLADARRAAAITICAILLFEGNDFWGIPQVYELYRRRLPATSLADLLLYATYAATFVLVVRRRSMRLPDPFTGPLLLLAVLLAAGLAWSELGGTAVRYQVISTLQTYTPVMLIPLVVVNVVEHGPDLRRIVGGYSALAIFKALTGLFVVFTGLATAVPGSPALTFYEPAGNLVLLTFLLGLAATAAADVPVPRWARVLGGVAFLCLLLSYRRTFWLAATLTTVLVVLIASGQVGRRLAVPVVLLAAGALYLGLQSGLAGGLSGPVVTRIESLSPAKVSRNDQDRYRLTERRNILAEIKAHPLTGIGVGVAWKQRYPLSFEQSELQYYSHVAALWHWMKFGVLGALAYVWLMATAALAGVQLFRGLPDRLVGCAALAAGMAIVGLAVVELASTVIGPDQRGGVSAGLLLGLLAVARRGLPSPPGSLARSSIATA